MNDENKVEVLDPLLTEDGHPIGEIVVSDGESVPASVSEESVAKNRELALRNEAAELVGEADADAAIAELYPFYTDVDKRKKALELYVTSGHGIEEISSEISVPKRTVSMWAYNGGWDRLLRKEIMATQAQSVLALARLRNMKREAVAIEQLKQAQKIRNKAMEDIEEGNVSLKSGTEAWSAAARIEHTLTGMSEAGTIANIDGGDDKQDDKTNNGKQPLVVVFQGGALPPRRSK